MSNNGIEIAFDKLRQAIRRWDVALIDPIPTPPEKAGQMAERGNRIDRDGWTYVEVNRFGHVFKHNLTMHYVVIAHDGEFVELGEPKVFHVGQ